MANGTCDRVRNRFQSGVHHDTHISAGISNAIARSSIQLVKIAV